MELVCCKAKCAMVALGGISSSIAFNRAIDFYMESVGERNQTSTSCYAGQAYLIFETSNHDVHFDHETVETVES